MSIGFFQLKVEPMAVKMTDRIACTPGMRMIKRERCRTEKASFNYLLQNEVQPPSSTCSFSSQRTPKVLNSLAVSSNTLMHMGKRLEREPLEVEQCRDVHAQNSYDGERGGDLTSSR